MVPTAYVVDRKFALTTNGKIDRAVLPEPPRSRPDVDSAYQEPRTDIEQGLHAIWVDLLELEGVGVHDNFFDLGGDSMRAARLTVWANELFGVEVDIDDLFGDESDIARMAVVVAEAVAAR
jgi:acyl carrier protein